MLFTLAKISLLLLFLNTLKSAIVSILSINFLQISLSPYFKVLMASRLQPEKTKREMHLTWTQLVRMSFSFGWVILPFNLEEIKVAK